MHNVIIIGAGGHSKVIADIVIKSGDNLLGFLDDFKNDSSLKDYDILGKVEKAIEYIDIAEFIIAIGDNCFRKEISEKYPLNWYTAIHPTAQVGVGCKIGEGSCIMANAVVNAGTEIGKHCIINSSAVVEHDNEISDFVHISPNATLCGTVKIGKLSHIGASAVVRNNISICEDVIIGVAAAVVKDITVSGKYVGVPAKKLI